MAFMWLLLRLIAVSATVVEAGDAVHERSKRVQGAGGKKRRHSGKSSIHLAVVFYLARELFSVYVSL